MSGCVAKLIFGLEQQMKVSQLLISQKKEINKKGKP